MCVDGMTHSTETVIYHVNKYAHVTTISPVRQPLSAHLGDDIRLVIVPQSTRQLLIGHASLALLLTPALGQTLRVHDAELEQRLVLPADDVIGRRVEQLGQEFPQ